VRRSNANFIYQAGNWTKPRPVIAQVEWHPGELYARVSVRGTTAAATPRASMKNALTMSESAGIDSLLGASDADALFRRLACPSD
jgi:hypothetical protein